VLAGIGIFIFYKHLGVAANAIESPPRCYSWPREQDVILMLAATRTFASLYGDHRQVLQGLMQGRAGIVLATLARYGRNGVIPEGHGRSGPCSKKKLRKCRSRRRLSDVQGRRRFNLN